MAISLENLSHVTSLAQLRLDREGQLETRSALGTLGHRIMDAFRSLSAEGRHSITDRNVRLFTAMQKAVDESGQPGGSVGETRDKLQTALDRLISANCGDYVTSLKNGIMNDPRVAALPEVSRSGLQYGLDSLAQGLPGKDWRGQMNFLRDTFLGIDPEGFSLERGVQKFGDGLRSLFFGSQQKKIDDSGFHRSFYADIDRSFISSIGGTRIDSGQTRADIPDQVERRAHFRTILTDFLTKDASFREEDLRCLPFLSMAGTQDGTASTCPMLSRDCGHKGWDTLIPLGIAPTPGELHVDTTISRDSANPRQILVQTRVSMGLVSSGNSHNSPALKLETGITMRIDLDAEPTVQTVNGRQVFLPAFTLEGASTRFTTEGL